ncbi:bifunctional 2-C-methyl-D-erythritol 4-phosphate cytidylyltransferase/2-C-methyl-D-erythritol 2,4-cyclodiphosphate synthase [Neptunicoccus cionae]|uniref:Bifunctional enzyme IspD/IspF n=1 Tax=Neptunicoccus cionae TaxID=2035344 RepID=A0A916QY84_9RHOB|nr:bifunctional 2-C-methyl-D-erythritol 4-phosphate cytidylyltransferase/2-C-methyl-D-erythritol 2,4-cyclodiphosphate synthase [Amylibacter cionae]GGA20617.1 bifunctional enzyme IspD/IspF [Amylibacter cionae]
MSDLSAEFLIVAAGRGTRAGGGIPKQYRPLRGKPVLYHTISACLASDAITNLRVVIHPDDLTLYSDTVAPITDARLQPPVFGGDSRSDSVRRGLAACNGSHVLIHDGARPLLERAKIDALLEALHHKRAAFLAVLVVDALWRADSDVAQAPVSRDGLWRAQTPQAFRLRDIRAAHDATNDDLPDDVETARAFGLEVSIVEGSQTNIKITQPGDFALAEQLMGAEMDIRTGNGFDVHKFGPGDHVTLNGVTIPHDQGLVGHSDADVAMHTLTDAIFGALAEGDIGQWFPPSEPEWKGAASDIFLRKAVERTAARGFTITHMDCTIICEEPKIGPHTTAMRQKLAEITGIDVDRISVKATTTEQLGFAGRKEGIAAQATATLVKL